MITPRQVFRYSVAATAGYTITSPVVAWLLSIARTLATIAILSFVLAIVSIVAWVETGDPWGLIYFGICVAFFLAAVLPLVIGARAFCRYAREDAEEGKNRG
jgi:hypothetical protein